MMLSKLLEAFRRWRGRHQIAKNERWLEARRGRVLESLVNELSPLYDRPYVIGGTYQWYVESPVHLDYFFPEVSCGPNKTTPLAVRVTGISHQRYAYAEGFVPSREFWEAETKLDSFTADVCSRASIPLLLITPNDPVDVYSLSVQVRALIGS